jgi:integrase
MARNVMKSRLGELAKGTDPLVLCNKMKIAPTLEAFSERYLTEVSDAHKKESTARVDRRKLKLHILPALGTLKVAEIDRTDVARFRAGMKATPVEANRSLTLLSHMLDYAVEKGERPDTPNPCGRVKQYQQYQREQSLSSEELGRLGAAILEAETVGIIWHPDPSKKVKNAPKEENRRVTIDSYSAAAFRLLLFTGARVGEILHLKWESMDMERGILFLPDRRTVKKFIVLNAPALAVLNGLPRGGPYVIGGQLGRSRAALKRPWALVRRRAALGGLRLHDLRYTVRRASEAINGRMAVALEEARPPHPEGCPDRVAVSILPQTSVRTTR